MSNPSNAGPGFDPGTTMRQAGVLTSPVLWFRIRSDRHHFAGSGKAFGLADPDLYPIRPNVKINDIVLFSRKFHYAVQNVENVDTYDVKGHFFE
jgi:hypothetical protein